MAKEKARAKTRAKPKPVARGVAAKANAKPRKAAAKQAPKPRKAVAKPTPKARKAAATPSQAAKAQQASRQRPRTAPPATEPAQLAPPSRDAERAPLEPSPMEVESAPLEPSPMEVESAPLEPSPMEVERAPLAPSQTEAELEARPAPVQPYLRSLRSCIYQVYDLALAREFYSQALGKDPYIDEPYYVGFEVDGHELGLDPDVSKRPPGGSGVIGYWRVDDINAAWQHLTTIGATPIELPHAVSLDVQIAIVADPFGNYIGLVQRT